LVHSITAAAQSHSADMDARIKRYLISMAIRTVCVILVLVIDSPIRWLFAALAIVLPYIAVVMANAAGGRRRAAVPAVPMIRMPLAPSGPLAPGGPGGPDAQGGPGAPAADARPGPDLTPDLTSDLDTDVASDLRSNASSERTN
jgi:hypothetical protein